MHQETYQRTVQIPSKDEFGQKYPVFASLARGEGDFLFQILTSPEAYIKAEIATLLGLAGIDGPASMIEEALLTQGVELTDHLKRYCGALVAISMISNGWQTTGEKRAVKSKIFTKGEVYKRSGSQNDTLPHPVGDDESGTSSTSQ